MLSPRIALKLYAEPASVPPHAKVLETWHSWLKEGTLGRDGRTPEVLVDVVDYGHVRHGPAVLLVGHESDYALDESEGRPGLLYVRKRAEDVPSQRLSDSLRRTVRAAMLLESAPLLAGLRFRTNEVLMRVLDRLNAPNDRATWDADKSEIVRVMTAALGPGTEVDHVPGDSRGPFTVRVRSGASRPLREIHDALAALAARDGSA